jgi:predicted lipoprotein with Yx(FWY)xxD motif
MFNWSRAGGHPAGGRQASAAGGALIFAAGALLLAACGGGSSSHTSTATQPSTTPSSTSAAASTSTGPTVMMASNAKYGPILEDAKGLALYTATGDTATKSACTGDCLKFWPPLLLPAGQTQPVAGPGVTGLGTLTRAEGTQVTYNGKPLYIWVDDKPGEVTGQGVVDTAGTWHVATVASGTSPAPATPTTVPPSPSTTTVPPSPSTTTVPPSPSTTAAPSSGGASF